MFLFLLERQHPGWRSANALVRGRRFREVFCADTKRVVRVLCNYLVLGTCKK
jgi:hypothetical protein